MLKLTVALLVASCTGLSATAQSQQGQSAQVQGPAGDEKQPEQKTPDPGSAPQNAAAATPSAAEQASGSETTEFPFDKFQNFSAMTQGGPLPGIESNIHIYRSGDLFRSEGSNPLPSYLVTDLSKRRSTSVSAYSCLHQSVPNIRSYPFFLSEPGNKYEVTPVGEDTVDGHHVHIEDLTIHRPKIVDILYFRLYEADDLQGFPIKIENNRKGAITHWVMHYTNVRLEPQDRSLFIVPEKCASDASWKKIGPGTKVPPKAPAPKQ